MTNDTPKTSPREKYKALRSWLAFVVFGAAIYFGNIELQSYLGRQALKKTGLESVEFEQALAQAKREDKLVLADMSAIWCPSCRRLDQKVFSDASVQATLKEHFIFSRIEYESDDGDAFMQRYDVHGFPTVLILNPDGSLRKKLPLTFDPERYVDYMLAAL